jgi:protein-tyrosine phosphatase
VAMAPKIFGIPDRGKDDSESFRDYAAASGSSMRPARGVRRGSMLSCRSWSQARKRTSTSLTNRPRPKVSGLGFRALPIPDRGVPPSREAVAELADQLVAALRSGKTVAVHCRQGIGQSAMIVAAALIAGGVDVGTAVNTIRQSRGLDVPEIPAQRQWISDFSAWRLGRRPAQQQHPADGASRRG